MPSCNMDIYEKAMKLELIQEQPMKIIRPGTFVELDAQRKLLITAVTITDGLAVKYQCVWWNDTTRIEAWLFESELRDLAADRVDIGFHTCLESFRNETDHH